MCSFGVSYSGLLYNSERWHQCTKITPYKDWIRKNKPKDAVFMYNENCNDEFMHLMYVPSEDLIYFKADLEYYYMYTIGKIAIDEKNKTIEITEVFCKNKNHWKELNSEESPDSQSGGYSTFKANFDYLRNMDMLEVFSKEMFGEGWVLQIKKEAPKLDIRYKNIAKSYYDKIFYKCGPWRKTVGIITLE
jgi:hypothetical protein